MWTEDSIELLIRLRRDGMSAGQIGARMGKSRNAIIGKLDRLGDRAPKAPAPSVSSTTVTTNAGQRGFAAFNYGFQGGPACFKTPAVKTKTTPPPLDMPKAKHTGVFAIAHLKADECRWPIGEVGDPAFRLCCAKQEWLSSYCPHHLAASQGRKIDG